MLFPKVMCLATLMAAAVAVPAPDSAYGSNPTYGCGKVDIFFTGLPPYHPLVTQQGFDPAQVDAALRADAANVIKAGYNLRVALLGPEQPLSVLDKQLNGVAWEGVGVGYGVRGTRLPDLTVRFEDIIDLYRRKEIGVPILFNYSPTSTLWAVQRRFPLNSNCTNTPGKDLGLNIFCDPSVCTNGTKTS